MPLSNSFARCRPSRPIPTPSSSASSGIHLHTTNPITPVFAHHVPITPTHNNHVATLHFRSHTTSLAQLNFFTAFALRAARALNLPTSGAISLPTRTSLYTVPRSPFAHKKSQENFWRKEHRRAIKVYDGDEEVVTAWLAYLRKEAIGGVGMKAQVFTYREVAWGAKMVGLDGVRDSVGRADDADVIQALAKEVVRELEEGVNEAEKNVADAGSAPELAERRVLDEVVPSEAVVEEAK